MQSAVGSLAIQKIGGIISRVSEISWRSRLQLRAGGSQPRKGISRNVQQERKAAMACIADVKRGATDACSALSQLLVSAQRLSNDSGEDPSREVLMMVRVP